MSKSPEPTPHADSNGNAQPRRTVRSFVLRGRTTSAQEKALSEHWPQIGIDLKPRQQLTDVLSSRPIVEIGIGNGDALVAMAEADPETVYLGVEVHRPGLGAALIEIQQRGLENVRLMNWDACELLAGHIPPQSLAGVRLFFPDPWHKTRHHKRRIVQPEFTQQVATALAPGALFHLATDWQPYAEHMLSVLEDCNDLSNEAGPGQTSPRPSWRPQTRFEKRGLKLGHQVSDLLYRRVR